VERRRWSRRRLVGAAVALVACGAAGAARAQSDPAAASIEAIVRESHNPELRWPRFPDYQHIVLGIYGPRSFAPLWLEGGTTTKQADAAIDALGAAGAQGLDPRDYDAAWLAERQRALASGAPASPDDLARFDTGLTVDFVRLVSDLHIGKVNPKNLEFGLDIDPKKYDLAELVTAAVRDDRIAETVANAPPAFSQNRLLVEQLARYQRLSNDPSAIPVDVKPPLRPGDAYDGAPALARWLAALGDVRAPVEDAPPVYEGDLVEGVKHFQARHGLTPDGVIGAETARALRVPAARRVRQIQLALERLRWIPSLAHGRVVFVDIPAFELFAFDEVDPASAPALEMRVVVGRALRTQTPVFTGALQTVVFAPYWNVPRDITVKEILPKLRQGLGYLEAEDMEIVGAQGVLPANAASVERLAAGAAQLRQRPGLRNALGRVKFLFPNSHSVYLHDTPSRQAFEKSRRDFSHGCVRVAEPAALATWVLRDAPEWTPERIAAAMGRTSETPVRVAPPVPVVIFYTTAIARHDGTISFFDDIYGYDAALEQALASGYPYSP